MADEGPPKPKPGSLKDRIKQFEVSSSSSSGGPAPPPLRPKPGTLGQWKPKPLDPPSPNKQATFVSTTQEVSQASDEHVQSAAMSATDAMSTISKGGGSLKERMAALQGKGAFGESSSNAAPPLPTHEGKPRVWRSSPAPPIEPRKVEESASPTADHSEDAGYQRSPMEPSPISPSNEHQTADAQAGEATEQKDAEVSDQPQTEEDQEREKRAAIAARMARLGGARVGMPVGFGVAAKGLHGGAKPTIPTKPKILTPGDTGSAGSSAPASALSPAPPSSTDDEKPAVVRQSTLDTALKTPLPKSYGSLLIPGSMDDDLPSESDASTSGKLVPPRSPGAPIPALPKRAAGPRRKKSSRDIKPTTVAPSEADTPPVPASLSTGETEAPIPPAEHTQPVDDPQVSTPTQETTTQEESAAKKVNEAGHSDLLLTEEPAAGSLDDLVSAAPSEVATPPPPSPSVMATEDEEDDNSSRRPSRRPTVDVSPSEKKIVEEEGSQLLTPRPQSESSEDARVPSLTVTLGNMVQSELTPDEDRDAPVGEDAEDEEAARKRRIAAKMASMGGVNPFSPGGFVSPVSPHSDIKGQADVKKEDSIAEKQSDEEEDSDQAIVTKSTTDNDSVVGLAAHESESNVPVLSQSHSTLSAANTNNEAGGQTWTDEEGDMVDLPDLDVDIEYPMMSPTGAGPPEMYAASPSSEPASRKVAAVEFSPQEESEKEYNEDDGRADTETIHDYPQATDEGTPPQRITRAIPPPPQSEEEPSVSTNGSSQFQPTAYEFENQSSRAVLSAALARRAPVPPGHEHDTSPSPQAPPHSISPTPSPPLRPFVREGAPSPPSLKSYSNEEYEEEYYDDDEEEEEEVEYLDYDVSVEQEEIQDTPVTELPAPEERVRTPSPPPVNTASPPPLPGGRPPIPNVRRSIPPPPRQALPPPPATDMTARPPPPLPATDMTARPPPPPPAADLTARPPLPPPTADLTARSPPPPPTIDPTTRPPPIPKQSIMVVAGSSNKGVDSGADYSATHGSTDDDDAKSIKALKHATERPALLPPPRTSSASRGVRSEREIMNDDEGDPVDPSFVGNRASLPASKTVASVPETRLSEETIQEAPADPVLDADAARRRGIAERMAKLGGIKFGMPVSTRPSPIRKIAEPDDESGAAEDTVEDSNLTPEEAERTRRAGIAARMAAMGGRGLGMYGAPPAPAVEPPPIPSSRPKRQSRDEVTHAVTRQPPPPPGNDMSESMGDETSESEVEMVNAEPEEEGEMIEQEEDEEPELVETPPALPTRSSRPSVPPASRPPPALPGSSSTSPPLTSSRRPALPASPPNEYEIVNDDRASSAKPRTSHSRSIPAPSAESTTNPSMESSGQWELPNIPSGSFDLGNRGPGAGGSNAQAGPSIAENDASWTKVDQDERRTRTKASGSSQKSSEPFSGPSPALISAESLVGLAHRLGPTIVSSAQHVHEKSKRLVIGDGSSISFLFMVLSPINGVSTSSLGHLIYAQTGNAVQKRLGDIMPGDIVALYDARFKGHKGGLGLGAYSLSCGTKDEPMLGVISEFEGKKNKIKAFSVNQHPNSYPTIDTPSYKLDDLKAGTLKVFRVAESS